MRPSGLYLARARSLHRLHMDLRVFAVQRFQNLRVEAAHITHRKDRRQHPFLVAARVGFANRSRMPFVRSTNRSFHRPSPHFLRITGIEIGLMQGLTNRQEHRFANGRRIQIHQRIVESLQVGLFQNRPHRNSGQSAQALRLLDVLQHGKQGRRHLIAHRDNVTGQFNCSQSLRLLRLRIEQDSSDRGPRIFGPFPRRCIEQNFYVHFVSSIPRIDTLV